MEPRLTLEPAMPRTRRGRVRGTRRRQDRRRQDPETAEAPAEPVRTADLQAIRHVPGGPEGNRV